MKEVYRSLSQGFASSSDNVRPSMIQSQPVVSAVSSVLPHQWVLRPTIAAPSQPNSQPPSVHQPQQISFVGGGDATAGGSGQTPQQQLDGFGRQLSKLPYDSWAEVSAAAFGVGPLSGDPSTTYPSLLAQQQAANIGPPNGLMFNVENRSFSNSIDNCTSLTNQSIMPSSSRNDMSSIFSSINNSAVNGTTAVATAAPTSNSTAATSASVGLQTNEECGIREVWADNLDVEFKSICKIVKSYPFVAMDTEFPGVVARPLGEFKSTAEYQYQLLKCNVDLLKIIQLGLTFMNEKGELPAEGCTTWQFNFKFNLTEDMYAEESVGLLLHSGIQFEKHEHQGIDPVNFAEFMIMSGLVLMPKIKWLSFSAGYDFGYLLSLLTNQNLPDSEPEFFEVLNIYFPNVYDVKYLMKSCKNLKGGLQEVATELEIARIGPQHQAGSDSLLTGLTFFKMKEMFFEDDIDDNKYCGFLFGLGSGYVVSSSGAANGKESEAAQAETPPVESVTEENDGEKQEVADEEPATVPSEK